MKKIYFSRSKKKNPTKANSSDQNIKSDFDEFLSNSKKSKFDKNTKKRDCKKGIKSTNDITEEKTEKRFSRKINPLYKISKLIQNINSISEKFEEKKKLKLLKSKNNVDNRENELVDERPAALKDGKLSQKLSEPIASKLDNKKLDKIDLMVKKQLKFSPKKPIRISDSIALSQIIEMTQSNTKLSKTNTLPLDSRNFDSESNSILGIQKINKTNSALNKDIADEDLLQSEPSNQKKHTIDSLNNGEIKKQMIKQKENEIRKKIKNLSFEPKSKNFFPENEPSETELFKTSLRNNGCLDDKKKNHLKSQFINCNRFGKSNNSIPKEAFTIRKNDIKEMLSDSTKQPANDYYKKLAENRLSKVHKEFYDKRGNDKTKYKNNLLTGSKNREIVTSFGNLDSSYNLGSKYKKRKILIMKDPRLKEEIVKNYYIQKSNEQNYETVKNNCLVQADSIFKKGVYGHKSEQSYHMCPNDFTRERSKSLNSAKTINAVELKKIENRKKNKITNTKKPKKTFYTKNQLTKMDKKDKDSMSVQTILEAESFSQFDSCHSQYLNDLDRWRNRNKAENEPGDIKPKTGNVQSYNLNLDEYRIYGKISDTTYGMVLGAKNGLQRNCAIKMIQKKYLQGDELNKIFDDGQKNLYVPAIVNKCPFFIQLQDIFQTHDHFYFVQELVDFVSLDVLMSYQGHFDESQVKFYSAGILLALNYLHRLNLTHRYLKLENVLVDKEGYPKISDFGRSNFFFNASGNWDKVNDLETLPNIQYTAPEVFCSSKYDRLVDYWSLGVCIQYMFTGKLVMNWRYLCDVVNEMDQSYSPSSMSLIKGLLKINPFMRLGAGPLGTVEIMNHQFYKVFNWDAYTNKDYKVPTPNDDCRISVVEFNEESYKDLKSVVKNKKKLNNLNVSENYKLNRVIEASTAEIKPQQPKKIDKEEKWKTDEIFKTSKNTPAPKKLEISTYNQEAVKTPLQQLEANKPEQNKPDEDKAEKIDPKMMTSKNDCTLSNMLIEIKNELERFKLNSTGAFEIDTKKIETQNEVITKLMDLENKNFTPRPFTTNEFFPKINRSVNSYLEKPLSPILKSTSHTVEGSKTSKQSMDLSKKNKKTRSKECKNKHKAKKGKKRSSSPDSSVSSSVSSKNSSTSEEIKKKSRKKKIKKKSSESNTSSTEYTIVAGKTAEILNNPHQFILNSSPSTQPEGFPKIVYRNRYSGELRSHKNKKAKKNKSKKFDLDQSDS